MRTVAVEDVEGVEHHGEVVVHLRCAALRWADYGAGTRCAAVRCGAMRWGGRRSRWGASTGREALGWRRGLGPKRWCGEGSARQGRQAGSGADTDKTDRRRPKLGRQPARPPAANDVKELGTSRRAWLACDSPTYLRPHHRRGSCNCVFPFFSFHCINSLPSFRVVARPARDTYIPPYLHPYVQTYIHT